MSRANLANELPSRRNQRSLFDISSETWSAVIRRAWWILPMGRQSADGLSPLRESCAGW
jgi:hypothetical protein